jgi:predicted RNase H-like HicB family nuclease
MAGVVSILWIEGGKNMAYKVAVVIEKDQYGYYAYAPELEGCQTQGDSLDEALNNIKEAVDLYIETLTEEELKQALSQTILTTSLEVAVA